MKLREMKGGFWGGVNQSEMLGVSGISSPWAIRTIVRASIALLMACTSVAFGAETLGNAASCIELRWANDNAECYGTNRCVHWKNMCTYRVELVVEVKKSSGQHLATLVEEVAPRGNGSTSSTRSNDAGDTGEGEFSDGLSPWFSDDRRSRNRYFWSFPEGRLTASVFVACRMFRKGGEYYGLDPDDYSRCLKPEDVEDAPAKPADKNG